MLGIATGAGHSPETPRTTEVIMEQVIWFKKQLLGQWRRDDGEQKKQVNEETMFREIEKLVNDGWTVETHGATHTRMFEVRKG
jgi:hypothetical protein